jgi:hypothetical protein
VAGGFCGFCHAWIVGGGLDDTGADDGVGVLLWLGGKEK